MVVVAMMLGPVPEMGNVSPKQNVTTVQSVLLTGLPLPRADELLAVFEKLIAEPDADTLQAAVGAALGLTRSEAMRVFRKACTKGGGLNDDAVSWIVQEKRQALRRTHALRFHRADTGLGDAQEDADYDLARLIWLWDVTSIADKLIINQNQQGVNSRYYRPGPYGPMEDSTRNFTEWYLETIRPNGL